MSGLHTHVWKGGGGRSQEGRRHGPPSTPPTHTRADEMNTGDLGGYHKHEGEEEEAPARFRREEEEEEER